jgi:hypothetical protein
MAKEQVAKMNRLRCFGLTLVLVCGLSAAVASMAQAATPNWTIEGTRLASGKTHNIQARRYGTGNFILTAANAITTCEAIALKSGVLLGSNTTGGTNNEVIVFSKCSATQGSATCKVKGGGGVSGEIITKPLKSTLVEGIGTKKPLLVLFAPEKKPTFVTLEFEGTGCTVTSAAVNGEVVALVTTDTHAGIFVAAGNRLETA